MFDDGSKNGAPEKAPPTTTDSGIPAASDEHSLTVGADGPIVLHDHYLVQKMQAFNRERVPERVVHAKGGGAFGYFEVSADVSEWTRAAFLAKVGKRTPVLARFSTVAGEQGYADTDRDPRGFALKFYTEEGNYDLVGNNTPVFFIRDPTRFQDFIHSQKRMPDTGLRSNNAQWDFWSLCPESLHQVAILMSDRGTPRTWRNMNGYGSHTFMWINEEGKRFWVKYHFKTEQGIQSFSAAEAKLMKAEDPDYHRRDLHQAIARKSYPVWRLEMQIMPFERAATYRFNPFDLTKVWPHRDYPPITVGHLVLDRNPENFFAQIEQAAFSPANMVPGIGASPDRMPGSGPTSSSSPSTARAAPCTPTTRTARCVTSTAATSLSMRRTAMAGRRPIPSGLATRPGTSKARRSCGPRPRCTRRTTISRRRATSTAT